MWSNLCKSHNDRAQSDGMWRFPIMKCIQSPHLNTGHQKSSHNNCHQEDKCHVNWHPLLFHSDEESRRCLNTYSPTRKSMAIKDYSVDVRDARKQVMTTWAEPTMRQFQQYSTVLLYRGDFHWYTHNRHSIPQTQAVSCVCNEIKLL